MTVLVSIGKTRAVAAVGNLLYFSKRYFSHIYVYFLKVGRSMLMLLN